MATTYYYTVDGQIEGESTSGVYTDYLTDALGSVTATVNSSAAVVNTYRYKPSGGLLAKTGIGDDPRFLWAGTWGYLSTTMNFPSWYVMSRHYADRLGQWTSRDLLWPDEFPYSYGRGNSVCLVDPSGKAPKRTYDGSGPCECGVVDLGWNFSISSGKNGWLIQRIKRVNKALHCKGDKRLSCVPPEHWGKEFVYFEAWKVKDGKVLNVLSNGGWGILPGWPHDLWIQGSPPAGTCTVGKLQIIGELMYVEGLLPPGFRKGNVKCAGLLPSTERFIAWKTQGAPGSMKVDWGCCCKGKGVPSPIKEKCPTKDCPVGVCKDCGFTHSP